MLILKKILSTTCKQYLLYFRTKNRQISIFSKDVVLTVLLGILPKTMLS